MERVPHGPSAQIIDFTDEKSQIVIRKDKSTNRIYIQTKEDYDKVDREATNRIGISLSDPMQIFLDEDTPLERASKEMIGARISLVRTVNEDLTQLKASGTTAPPAPTAASETPTTTPYTPSRLPQLARQDVALLGSFPRTFGTISMQAKLLLGTIQNKSVNREAFLNLVSPGMKVLLNTPPPQELLDKLNALEQQLKATYQDEFFSYRWHGGLSFQRIIFQDPLFAQAFSDPLFMQLLFYRLLTDDYQQASQGKPPAFSGPLTFPQMVFNALAENSLDFLVSASPNGIHLPEIENFTWETGSLAAFRSVPSKNPMPSPNKSQDILSIQQGLGQLQGLFNPIQPTVVSPVQQAINTATAKQLFTALSTALKGFSQEELQTAIFGGAGASTDPIPMLLQCLTVLPNYTHLREKGYNPSLILELTPITHALDGKHLLAGIAYICGNKELKAPPERQNDVKGAKELKELIDTATSGTGDPQVAGLMTARLRQAAFILSQALPSSKRDRFLQDLTQT